MGRLFHRETMAGKPILHQGRTITPFMESIRFQPPRYRGVVIWQRPASVVVRDRAGNQEVLTVPDVTRQAIFSMAGFVLAGLLSVLTIALVRRAQTSDS